MGPDLTNSWQMVAQAKHAKDLDASASKVQSHHVELQENAAEFCFDIDPSKDQMLKLQRTC